MQCKRFEQVLLSRVSGCASLSSAVGIQHIADANSGPITQPKAQKYSGKLYFVTCTQPEQQTHIFQSSSFLFQPKIMVVIFFFHNPTSPKQIQDVCGISIVQKNTDVFTWCNYFCFHTIWIKFIMTEELLNSL